MDYAAALVSTTPLSIFNNSGSLNKYNGISLTGSIGTSSLQPNVNFPYIIGSLTVSAGKTLTITSGSVMKFISLGELNVSTGATLQALADPGNQIVFTSIKDDSYFGDSNNDRVATSPAPGDWWKIDVYGSASFANAIIRYGGNDPYAPIGDDGANLLLRAGSITNVSSSIISHAKYDGVMNYGSSLSVTSSLIYNNQRYGIYNSHSTYIIDARNNWWGSSSGPAPIGSGNAINFTTYSCGTPPVTCYNYRIM